jgi:hypothetical protein
MFSEHWALYTVCSVSIEPYTKYVQWALSPIQSMFSEHWALYKVRSVSIEPYTKYVQWALSLIQSMFIEPYTKYVQWALSLIQSTFSEHWALYKVCSESIEPDHRFTYKTKHRHRITKLDCSIFCYVSSQEHKCRYILLLNFKTQ